jgi:hypothetical protein
MWSWTIERNRSHHFEREASMSSGTKHVSKGVFKVTGYPRT